MFCINLMGRIKQLEKLVGKHIEDLHTCTYVHMHTHAYALGSISKFAILINGTLCEL